MVTDSSGEVAARFEYEPFGLVATSTGPLASGAHRFTGKPEDGAIGFYYFGARYYDPEVGRFISRDPARDGLNWYAYCYQNPLAYVDPDGEYPWDAESLLKEYRSDIIRIAKAQGIPPAALAIVVYGENVLRSHVSEVKDQVAILALIMYGHDASIGVCQVKFSTALMLDLSISSKYWATLSRAERQKFQACLAKAAMPYAELYVERLSDPVTCMKYAARYLAFLAEARDYESPEVWLSDYNRGLSEYKTATAYGQRYTRVANRYAFAME